MCPDTHELHNVATCRKCAIAGSRDYRQPARFFCRRAAEDLFDRFQY